MSRKCKKSRTVSRRKKLENFKKVEQVKVVLRKRKIDC